MGICIGGYFFSDSQQRALLKVGDCNECLSESELIGLLASVGIQKTPALIPKLIFESDFTIVIDFTDWSENLKLSHSYYKNRYIFIPKHDIKSTSDFSERDREFIIDLHASVVKVVNEQKIEHYELYTSGPKRQHVNYLHYHLVF